MFCSHVLIFVLLPRSTRQYFPRPPEILPLPRPVVDNLLGDPPLVFLVKVSLVLMLF